MFRVTQDKSSGSIDSYIIKTTRNGSTVHLYTVRVWRHFQELWCVCPLCSTQSDAASTHFTGPEYATKHQQSTEQTLLNHCFYFYITRSQYSLMMNSAWSEICWINFNVWFT
jgi:hypothetical protein